MVFTSVSSQNRIFLPLSTSIAVLLAFSLACRAESPTQDQIQTGTPSQSPTQDGVDGSPQVSRAIEGGTGSVQFEDWPHFLGARQDGTSIEKGIRTDWSDGKLPVVWSKQIGTSYGIGSIANGRYYQFHRVGDSERLSCLDAMTGEEIWNADHEVQYEDMYGYNNGPRTSPTVDGQFVYTMGVAGRLTCRDVASGKEQWAVDTNVRYGVVQNFFGVGCSPLIVDDLVLVMVGGSPAQDQNLPPGRLDRVSANGSAVVAFDKLTGTERYKTGDYLASYASLRSANVEGRQVVFAFVREGLLAIEAASGKQLWMYPWRSDMLESVNAAMPVLDGNEIFVSECYQIGSALLKLSSDSYEVVREDSSNRRLQTFRAHWATPIKIGNYLYGCSGRNPPDSDLRCINWKTGEVAWADPRRERTSLLYIDGHFVVMGERGGLELIKATPDGYQSVTELDLATFNPAQPKRPPISFPCWAAPIVSHGLMYVRGDETVICFELIEGSAK